MCSRGIVKQNNFPLIGCKTNVGFIHSVHIELLSATLVLPTFLTKNAAQCSATVVHASFIRGQVSGGNPETIPNRMLHSELLPTLDLTISKKGWWWKSPITANREQDGHAPRWPCSIGFFLPLGCVQGTSPRRRREMWVASLL